MVKTLKEKAILNHKTKISNGIYKINKSLKKLIKECVISGETSFSIDSFDYILDGYNFGEAFEVFDNFYISHKYCELVSWCVERHGCRNSYKRLVFKLL